MLVEIVYNGVWVLVLFHVTHYRPKYSLLAYYTLPKLIEWLFAILDLHIRRLWFCEQMLAVHKIAADVATDHHAQLINSQLLGSTIMPPVIIVSSAYCIVCVWMPIPSSFESLLVL